jgi:hypothetical protein
MTAEMELVVDTGGSVTCIYDEALDLREIGPLKITRSSHVEPDAEDFRWVDMRPVDGPVLGPFKNRTEALEKEREWLLALSDSAILMPIASVRPCNQQRPPPFPQHHE